LAATGVFVQVGHELLHTGPDHLGGDSVTAFPAVTGKGVEPCQVINREAEAGPDGQRDFVGIRVAFHQHFRQLSQCFLLFRTFFVHGDYLRIRE
jgi:hypothetical protein